MAADPGYLANLMALSAVERARLLGGNWKIRRRLTLLQAPLVQIVDAVPAGIRAVRYWTWQRPRRPKPTIPIGPKASSWAKTPPRN